MNCLTSATAKEAVFTPLGNKYLCMNGNINVDYLLKLKVSIVPYSHALVLSLPQTNILCIKKNILVNLAILGTFQILFNFPCLLIRSLINEALLFVRLSVYHKATFYEP